MPSIKYNVVNKKLEFGNSIFSEMIACKMDATIQVMISPHVILPLLNTQDAGHMSKGSIVD